KRSLPPRDYRAVALTAAKRPRRQQREDDEGNAEDLASQPVGDIDARHHAAQEIDDRASPPGEEQPLLLFLPARLATGAGATSGHARSRSRCGQCTPLSSPRREADGKPRRHAAPLCRTYPSEKHVEGV